MPCRMHFSESWTQRLIISNEKVSYSCLGVLPENMWISFLHSNNSESDLVCCLKVNKSCPHFRMEGLSYLQLFLQLLKTFWSFKTNSRKTSKSTHFYIFTKYSAALFFLASLLGASKGAKVNLFWGSNSKRNINLCDARSEGVLNQHGSCKELDQKK